MILKNISNAHFALLQRLCHDQWQLQKCYARLRAINLISYPPDAESFGKLVFELVSHSYMNFWWNKILNYLLFVFVRGTSVDCPSALGLLVKYSSFPISTLAFSKTPLRRHPVTLIFNSSFPMLLHFYWIYLRWSRGKWKFLPAGTTT